MKTVEYSKVREQKIATHGLQIAYIESALKKYMQLIVDSRKDIRELAAAQKRTEKNLEKLIAGLGRGAKGKH
jgi:hypothetical protein